MEMLKEVSAALQAQKIIPLPRKYTTPERRDIKQGLQRGPVRFREPATGALGCVQGRVHLAGAEPFRERAPDLNGLC